MAIITLPAKFSFTSIASFRLERYSASLRSQFTGQRQVITYPLAVWYLKGKLKDYAPEDARQIRAFLAKLRGQANSFRLPVPGVTAPSTGYVANRSINLAASSGATTVQVSGGTAGAAYINEGDYLVINDELKIATENVVFSNPIGTTVVSFEPPLRKAILGNNSVQVVVANPTCLMAAANDDILDMGLKPPIIHSFEFEAVEALDI